MDRRNPGRNQQNNRQDRADRIRRNRQNRRQPDDPDSPADNGGEGTTAIVLGVLGHAGLLAGGLFFLPLVFIFTGSSLPPVAVAALFAAVMGSAPAYLLRDQVNFKGYSAVAVAESCVIAIMAGFNAAIYQALQQLQQFEQELNAGNHTGSSLGGGSSLSGTDSIALANTEATIHPEVFFATVFLLFNAPFIYYSIQRRDTDWRYMALYLIPILLYLGMRFLLPGLLTGDVLYNMGTGL